MLLAFIVAKSHVLIVKITIFFGVFDFGRFFYLVENKWLSK